jgi:HAMP domain-containing protein
MERRPASARSSAPQEWWWIFDPRYSLRARAALLCGGGALVVTLLLGGIARTLVRRSLESHVGSSFENLAVQIADKIDRTIFERARALELASNLPALRNADVAPAERRRVLEVFQQSAPDFGWIGFMDTAGRVVAATGGIFENADLAERPWFRLAREQRYTGGVRDLPELARDIRLPGDPDNSTRFFDLAVPVTGANGQFAGVLAAHVRWGWARDVQLSVVAEPALRAQTGVTIYAGPGDILLDTGSSGWTEPPNAPAVPENRRFRGALIENAAGGTTYLTGYARSRGFREYRGLGWLTTVRQPVERVFAPVGELWRSVVGWGLVFTVVSLVSGWLLAAPFSRRLRKIAAAADRIREGDVLTVLPRPPGESEIARVCGTLGDMVEDFRAKQASLASENAQLRAQAAERESVKRG